MSETNNEATQTDESSVNDFDFDALADEILGLEPDEATQESDEATEELEGEDHNTEEDADEVDDAEDGDTEEDEEDEDESEDATQKDSDLDDESDIDMEFKVPVKIDGEQSEVSMEELVASYQTKQSQSKKGDEIAEQTKNLAKAKEESALFAQINSELLQIEDGKDQQILQSLKDKVDEAYDEDDRDAGKLNRQLEKANEEYRTRKANRDSVVTTMSNKISEQRQNDFNESIKAFQEEISTHIPDWSEKVALKNREFALGLGINEQILDNITDPIVVKVLDGYRRLKEGSEKGVVKRKKATIKRVPTKKVNSANVKKSNKVEAARKNVSKGRASEKDRAVLFDNVIDDIFS
jgi:hypothetical protein